MTDYLEIGHPAHRRDVGGVLVLVMLGPGLVSTAGQTPPAPGLCLLARAEM